MLWKKIGSCLQINIYKLLQVCWIDLLKFDWWFVFSSASLVSAGLVVSRWQ